MRPAAMVVVTLRLALHMSEDIDGLQWVEITTHGDPERMVLITTPRCGYCGRFAPTPVCAGCGAHVVRAGAS